MKLVKCIAFMAILVLCLGMVSAVEAAQPYPSKPIEYIVHSSAGGSSDTFTRTIANFLAQEKLVTVPITVMNRTGGGGAVAYKYVASRAGDPYTLLNIPSTFITTPIIAPDCPNYEEFTLIANLVLEPDVFVVNAKSEFHTIDDLINAAKTIEGGITFAIPSIGSYDHLAQMLFAKAVGGKVVALPFSSDAEAMIAVLGDHAHVTSVAPRIIMPQVLAGELRALAITSEGRYAPLPDVPTMKEQGIDLVIGTPRGVAAPKNIPEEARAFLTETYKKLSETESWKEVLQREYLMPLVLFGDDYVRFMKAESERSQPLLEEAGLIQK